MRRIQQPHPAALCEMLWRRVRFRRRGWSVMAGGRRLGRGPLERSGRRGRLLGRWFPPRAPSVLCASDASHSAAPCGMLRRRVRFKRRRWSAIAGDRRLGRDPLERSGWCDGLPGRCFLPRAPSVLCASDALHPAAVSTCGMLWRRVRFKRRRWSAIAGGRRLGRGPLE